MKDLDSSARAESRIAVNSTKWCFLNTRSANNVQTDRLTDGERVHKKSPLKDLSHWIVFTANSTMWILVPFLFGIQISNFRSADTLRNSCLDEATVSIIPSKFRESTINICTGCLPVYLSSRQFRPLRLPVSCPPVAPTCCPTVFCIRRF